MQNIEVDYKTVDKIIEKLGELPSAPVILNKVMQLTSSLDANIMDISKHISADQSLSAKVVRMSNSAIYGRTKEINSLDEAIKVLGFTQVRSIIVSASTFNIFKSGTHTKIADLLWQHSVAVALGSKMITAKFTNLDKEEAYLAGLLHDIGKLVLLQTAPNVFEEIIAKIKESDQSFSEVAIKVLGFNHQHIGQALLVKWEFPTHLIEEISCYHNSNISEPEEVPSIARSIALANSMANYIGASFFNPFHHSTDDQIFIGQNEIDVDEFIELRLKFEENYHKEINSYYE
ncbi:MAG: HDOD domain-containing protein [Calditrichaeota bacterium]|nr:MAG: HDOD domain-containing protein [Calditrichota bacterium]